MDGRCKILMQLGVGFEHDLLEFIDDILVPLNIIRNIGYQYDGPIPHLQARGKIDELEKIKGRLSRLYYMAKTYTRNFHPKFGR